MLAIHVIPTKLVKWVASKTPDGVTFNIPLMIINEVMKAFKTIDDKKATGADDLSAKYLKAAASSICIQLTHIINKSFLLNKYPEIWKVAKVFPSLRSGSKEELDNYSIFSVSYLRLQKNIHFYKFLTNNCLLVDTQQD